MDQAPARRYAAAVGLEHEVLFPAVAMDEQNSKPSFPPWSIPCSHPRRDILASSAKLPLGLCCPGTSNAT